eukprot:CAMPEP_0174370988 /NCGR_PEP_ID=MMETSP0811_2-20130205/98147_1 /TAXON_ID=73025 ORGANISM="Eutreptiella gymnastica-like, Strain CCMP1594" /NCGR_SAMPLE_ID=MMETSP0811_2 /ASSEMBLY_ACC=CAM_ASM_000667 /LENGTH=35 /DNA_ID= /DNA_START= /DNA_END= /DNA_ORIENTATION=
MNPLSFPPQVRIISMSNTGTPPAVNHITPHIGGSG